MHGAALPPSSTLNSEAESDLHAPLFRAEYKTAFFVVTALFFLWAVPHNLNDVLIRQFMKAFQLSRFQAGLVQSAFYFGYFCISMPAAYVLRRWGYRAGLVTGVLLYGVGCVGFWPAAVVNRYSLFLIALFVIAAGLAFLETGGGLFIALLGEPSTSERRLNFAQAFNPPGTIAGALIGTLFIFSGVEKTPAEVAQMQAAGTYAGYLHTETMRVAAPYLAVAAVVFVFAVVLWKVKLPAETSSREQQSSEKRGAAGSLLKVPHFVGAVVSQFFYMAAQVGSWSFLIQYAMEYAHLTERQAGYYLSGGLLFFSLGRFVATLLMKYVRPNVLMGVYAFVNVALLLVVMFVPGWLGLWSLMLTSFFMSLMYPTTFALGLKGLDEHTTLGASVLVMAIIGGAVAPPIVGWFAERLGQARSFGVPLICYLVVAWFAFVGSRMKAKAA